MGLGGAVRKLKLVMGSMVDKYLEPDQQAQ